MIDHNLIFKIIHNTLQEKPINIKEIIGKGFVNRTFFIETRETKYIVRAREENAISEYQKEKWCMNQAVLLGIPTPEVLYIGRYEDISYMIETFIEGDNGLDSNNPEEVWYYIGKYSKKLHSIPVLGFGLELTNPKLGEFTDTFSPTLTAQVDYNISQLTSTDSLYDLGVYEKDNVNELIKILEYIKLCNYSIGLNHSDLSRKNTIVNNGNVALIDYGCAIAHAVPLYDFSYIFGETVKGSEPSSSMVQSFIDGYGLSISELDDMKKDIYAVMLLNALDKTRWAVDHKEKDTVSYATFANKVLSHTLKFFK